MFNNREEMRRRLQEIVEKFRQHGATSPEKAMTIQELGLPPQFETAMHRRLGQSGIIVEVNGKYYLNEERLRQFQERRAQMGSGSGGGDTTNRSGPPSWYRYLGVLLMLPIGIIVAFVLVYFFAFNMGGGYFPGEFLLIMLVIFLVLFVVRMMFWRSRRRYMRSSGW